MQTNEKLAADEVEHVFRAVFLGFDGRDEFVAQGVAQVRVCERYQASAERVRVRMRVRVG